MIIDVVSKSAATLAEPGIVRTDGGHHYVSHASGSDRARTGHQSSQHKLITAGATTFTHPPAQRKLSGFCKTRKSAYTYSRGQLDVDLGCVGHRRRARPPQRGLSRRRGHGDGALSGRARARRVESSRTSQTKLMIVPKRQRQCRSRQRGAMSGYLTRSSKASATTRPRISRAASWIHPSSRQAA